MSLVELRGGLVVREEAIALGVALEARGHVLTADGAALQVTHGSRLTAEDVAGIRAHKRHLVALAGYEAPRVG